MRLKMNDGDALQLVLLIRGVDDFSIETAALKTDRSFVCTFWPALFRVRYHSPWFLFFFLWSEFCVNL